MLRTASVVYSPRPRLTDNQTLLSESDTKDHVWCFESGALSA